MIAGQARKLREAWIPGKIGPGGISMDRRKFLVAGGTGLAPSTSAAPAIAQSAPTLKWRMATSWPKSLDTIFGGAEYFAKRVAEMTDNNFQIRVFAGGEIVQPLQVLDAGQNNKVEREAPALLFEKDGK